MNSVLMDSGLNAKIQFVFKWYMKKKKKLLKKNPKNLSDKNNKMFTITMASKIYRLIFVNNNKKKLLPLKGFKYFNEVFHLFFKLSA